MNFEFNEDSELMREQARKMLQAQCPTTLVRQYLPGDQGFDRALWQQMAELGWLGVTVAELEPETKPAAARSGKAEPKAPAAGVAASVLGLTVSDLSAEQRREARVKAGVRVEAVDGPAARAGLREGDLILGLGQAEVTDARQFDALVARLDRSRPASLLVRRGGEAQFVLIRPNPAR